MERATHEETGRLSLADAPDVLTPEQTQRVLGLGRNTVYEAIQRNEIPSIKIGRRLLVPKAGLVKLLDVQPAATAE